jgi:hypothetical protein
MTGGLSTTIKELIAALKETENGHNNASKKLIAFKREMLTGQEMILTCGYPIVIAGLRSTE